MTGLFGRHLRTTTLLALGITLVSLATMAAPAGAGASAPAPKVLVVLHWTLLSPTQSPPARAWTAMGYDASDGYDVLYGGFNNGVFYNDTWEYQSGTWTQIKTSTTPAGEIGMVLTYDPALKGLVTFGGRDAYSDSSVQSSTWLYRAGAWTQISTATSPAARASYAMAYDVHLHEIVMFGGVGSTGAILSDTWTFNGTNWNQLAGSGPNGSEYASMVYDAPAREILLVGGYNATAGAPGGTWALRGHSWKLLRGANTPSDPTFAYVAEPGTAAPVLFGGSQDAGMYLSSSTYEFVGTHWVKANATNGPSPRNNGAIAWDPSIHALLIFSGFLGFTNYGSSYSSQTWSLK